jgi:tRNA-dihydrouridine synthase A
MVSCDAIIFGNRDGLLKYNPGEHPVGLQIGGSSIEKMTEAAIIGEAFGFDEINLNIGCPSPRVQKGNFGACLMSNANLVSEIILAIKKRVKIPVTVKCRLGIDDQDIEKELPIFMNSIIEAGVDLVIVHARKAILSGITPKENRTIPELNYNAVYAIKEYISDKEIIINGGINSIGEIYEHLKYTDGVMLGRKIIHDPIFVLEVDEKLFSSKGNKNLKRIIENYSDYADRQTSIGTSRSQIIKPIMSLFNNRPNAKKWRRGLDQYRNSNYSALDYITELHANFIDGVEFKY